jgi:tetratricopeptide (TPR) repeat protein
MSDGVLALCSQSNREMVRKALSRSQFKISFISSLTEVNSAIVQFKPSIFIHDWQAVDPSQTRQFHLKFSHTSQAEGVQRILLVPDATASILAFAHDALIDKVMTYGSAILSLESEIGMLTSLRSNELEKLLRESRDQGARYDQATLDRQIADIFKKFPHDPKVKLEFGNLNFRQGSFPEAVTLAEELLHKDPLNFRAMNLKAKSLMKTGDWAKATATLAEANFLSPSNPDRLLMLGDAFYGKGDLDKAVAYYEEASVADPDRKNEAQAKVGMVRIDQGRLEDALELFKGSASEEEAAGYFNNAAVIAVRDGKFQQAVRLYYTALKALKTNKLKPRIYFNIALTLRRMGMDEEAMKALKRTLHYDPGFEKAQAHVDDIIKRKAKKKI